MKNKTAIDKLIFDLKELEDNKKKLTHREIIKMLEEYQFDERKQIEEAFEAGAKCDKDIFSMFDHPASRYYQGTYKDAD